MSKTKTLLATTALAFVAAHASAVDVEMYGQVNKGMFAYNDGETTDFVVFDNSLSSTRLGVKGAQVLDNGLTASVLLEGEMTSNASNNFQQAAASGSGGTATTPANTSANFAQRQARVGLSGDFGGVYLGQQNTAIDGVLTQDLAGAQDVMSADFVQIGGNLKVRDSSGAFSGSTILNITGALAQSRANSVRYDSPIVGGAQARASVAQGGDMEGSLLYDGELAGLKVKGAAGMRFDNDTTTSNNAADKYYSASVSVAHDSGLAGTVAYMSADTPSGSNPDTWYTKVGYAWDSYEVAADYAKSTLSASSVKAYGLGAQYNMGHGVSLAGLYRKFDTKLSAVDAQDIDLYGVNVRVKF